MIQQIIKDYQLDINQYHDLFLLIASLSTLSYSLNNIAEINNRRKIVIDLSYNKLQLFNHLLFILFSI